jgi:hypothetical protein
VTSLLHLEWRVNGVRALRRLGIESVVDLDKFDHRRLGLIIRNRQDGTKSRVATPFDKRAGSTLILGHSANTAPMAAFPDSARRHLLQVPFGASVSGGKNPVPNSKRVGMGDRSGCCKRAAVAQTHQSAGNPARTGESF